MTNKLTRQLAVTSDDFEAALASYADLLKASFESNDLEGFRIIYNDYENLQYIHTLIEKYYDHFKNVNENPPVEENNAVVFPIPVSSEFEILWKWCSLRYALYAWIIYVHSTNSFTHKTEDISEFISIIENSASGDNSTSLNDWNVIFNIFIYLQINGSDILNFENWEWSSKERLDMKTYWGVGVHDWIPYGLAVFLIRQGGEYDTPPLFHLKIVGYKYLSEKLNKLFTYFGNEFEKWNIIIGKINRETFDERSLGVRSLFNILNKEYAVELDKTVVKEPLDKERVESFIAKELDIWKTKSEIGDFFYYFDGIRKVEQSKSDFTIINVPHFIEAAKRQFTKNYQFDILGFTVVWPLVKFEEKQFLSILEEFTTLKDGVQYSLGYELIENAISELSIGGINPTVIILSRSVYPALLFRTTATAENYREAELDDPLRNSLVDLVGYYKNIPVCLIKISSRNLLIIADFHRTFCKYQLIDESIGSEGLGIQVKPISFDRAKDKLIEKGDSFLQREYGMITEEEAIIELQTGIEISLHEEFKFKVLDPKAMRIYNITFDYS